MVIMFSFLRQRNSQRQLSSLLGSGVRAPGFSLQTLNKGFSIIELVVVITIFAIMSSVTIFNYSSYRQNIEVTNVAQDIALTVRQAQVYGISSTDRIVGTTNLDSPLAADQLFGQSIADITNDHSIRGLTVFPDENKIILFEDNNRNFIYDTNDRIIDQRTIISTSVDIVGVKPCITEVDCANLQTDRADIVFQRPYPDAYISFGGDRHDIYGFITIVVGGANGTTSHIQISSVGSISVKRGL